MKQEAVKKRVKIGLGISLTALALWLSFRKIEWSAVVDSFTEINIFWVIVATASNIFFVYALGWRWRILLKSKGDISPYELFKLNVISQYVNIIAPARLGEIARAYLASKKHAASGAYILGTVVIERILDIYVFVLLWTLIPGIFALQGSFRYAGIAVFFCLLSACLLALFIWKPKLCLKWATSLSRILPFRLRPKVLDFLKQGIEAFNQLQSARTLVVLFFFTLGLITGQALTNYFLFKALHLPLTFWAGLAVLLAIQVGNIPPSAPGKVGIFEYATILALSVFAVEKTQALSYALLLHLVAYLPKIILGGIYITKVDLKRSPQEVQFRSLRKK
jgi:uncharacterized protein (TIRG00374 family)